MAKKSNKQRSSRPARSTTNTSQSGGAVAAEKEFGRAHISDGNCKPVPTTTNVRFVTSNKEGLSRLYEPDVCAHLPDFDFWLLVETFAESFPSLPFPLYDVSVALRVKLTDGMTAKLWEKKTVKWPFCHKYTYSSAWRLRTTNFTRLLPGNWNPQCDCSGWTVFWGYCRGSWWCAIPIIRGL